MMWILNEYYSTSGQQQAYSDAQFKSDAYSQIASAAAIKIFDIRAMAISSLKAKKDDKDCQDALKNLGATPDELLGALEHMDIESGYGSNATVGSLYRTSSNEAVSRSGGSITTTIDKALESSPNTSFMSQLGGNVVYYNPYAVVQYGSVALIATIMHEGLHNLDKGTDPDLMRKLPDYGRGSQGISLSLLPCVGW
jgi:hypothetical protein